MQDAKQRQAEFQKCHGRRDRVCHSQAQLNGLLRSKHHRLVHLLPHPDGDTVEHGATASKAGPLLVSTLMPYCTPRWMLWATLSAFS